MSKSLRKLSCKRYPFPFTLGVRKESQIPDAQKSVFYHSGLTKHKFLLTPWQYQEVSQLIIRRQLKDNVKCSCGILKLSLNLDYGSTHTMKQHEARKKKLELCDPVELIWNFNPSSTT